MPARFRSVFIPLLWHEFRHQRVLLSKRKKMKKPAALVSLILIAAAAAWCGYIYQQPEAMMIWLWQFLSASLPWFFYGYALLNIFSEWSNTTSHWWLTLPCSRIKLIVSKFSAILIQAFFALILISVLMELFEGYAVLINPAVSFRDFSAFTIDSIYYFGWTLSSFPIMIALGLLLGIIINTHWWPLTVILIAIPAVAAFVDATEDSLFDVGTAVAMIAVAVSWVASVLLLLFAAWLLEKKLNL